MDTRLRDHSSASATNGKKPPSAHSSPSCTTARMTSFTHDADLPNTRTFLSFQRYQATKSNKESKTFLSAEAILDL